VRLVIDGKPGRVFYAEGHPDLMRVRPVYCFVPEGQPRSTYAGSCWPSINTGANPNAIGSHVFPDWSRPVPISECLTLRRFLENLPRFIAKASAK